MTQSWVEPETHEIRMKYVTPEDMGETEEEPFFSSIWFDPGGTTGWSVFGVWPEALADPALRILGNVAAWSAGEFSGPEGRQVDQMMALVEAWPGARIGWEDFILQKFTMARDLLAPVRISARLLDRLEGQSYDGQIESPQSASLAMRTVTDDRLKAWGYWNPLSGQPHARDAVRHNITFLRRHKETVVRLLAKGSAEPGSAT